MTPEKKVKNEIVKILKSMGVYYFYPVASGYGASGVPDIVACINGRFVGIECKAGKGEPTALAITRGFGDALRIAYQNRPRLFDRHIVLPELLYQRVIEIDERIGAHGDVLQAPQPARVRADFQAAFDAGFRSLAIVLMHSHWYPQHERLLADIAREIGRAHV